MNVFPFNLTGPQFLVFYPLFALGVAGLIRFVRDWRDRHEETPEPVLPHLGDPYRIALLRDGRRAAVHTAVISLVERGLLTAKSDGSTEVAAALGEELKDALDHAVLRVFAEGGSLNGVIDAPPVRAATTAMRTELETQGLLSTARQRASSMLPAVGLPLAIGALRILFSKGHPHGFLLLEMLGFALLAALISDQRVTHLGRRVLEHLQALLGRASSPAGETPGHASGSELALLAATLGIAAWSESVADAAQPERLRAKIASVQETLDFLRDQRKQGGGCGSGCGGGCGGCGGCGGD